MAVAQRKRALNHYIVKLNKRNFRKDRIPRLRRRCRLSPSSWVYRFSKILIKGIVPAIGAVDTHAAGIGDDVYADCDIHKTDKCFYEKYFDCNDIHN